MHPVIGGITDKGRYTNLLKYIDGSLIIHSKLGLLSVLMRIVVVVNATFIMLFFASRSYRTSYALGLSQAAKTSD